MCGRRWRSPQAWHKGANFLWPVDAVVDRYEPDAALVQLLEDAGHEIAHWSTTGDPRAPDTRICDYAGEHGYVVITNDLDFPQILAQAREAGPSVVLLRGEPLVPEVRGAALVQALEDCAAELAQGAIVSLDWSDKPRARVLPLR